MRPRSCWGLALCLLWAPAAQAQNPPVTVTVDAGPGTEHPISPLIYGVHFADTGTLTDLGATLNRYGGNSSGRYNWLQNIDNRGVDWYFESIPYLDPTPGEVGDTFIATTKAGGAEPFLTMPMVGWVAKTNASRDIFYSFSVATYGAQVDVDPFLPDAGNGCAVGPDVPPCVAGTPISRNDPNDASLPADGAFQQGWMQHVFDTWGPASGGGLKYWGLDNEPSIWHAAYWDVHPAGAGMDEMIAKMIDYGGRLRTVDAGTQVLAPEEWGWDGYFYSGMDQQLINQGACGGPDCPDRLAHGGADYVPYLLTKMKEHQDTTGQKVLDMLTLHFYPQGGEFSDDVTVPMQLLRNRSTRGLWDSNYVNESWINAIVELIPRMKGWVGSHYPGLPVGLTEYNWGAENHINGATAQADILGILGREAADMATRWVVPPAGSPVYNAFKMYRNYDGAGSVFGETSVSAGGPNPDEVAAYAAERASDGALTIMVISKVLSGNTPATINLANFSAGPAAQAWRLTATNVITQLADIPVTGNSLSLTLPLQSITLLVVPPGVTLPTISIGDVGVAEGDGGTTSAVFMVTLSAPSGQTVSASFATADGTATAGQDYVPASGTVSFAPGSTAQPVSVDVLGDTIFEGDETFVANITNPVNGTIGDGQGLGTIVDDETGISLSSNELNHGAIQWADLSVRPDYYRIGQGPHTSYEVVVDSTSGDIVPVALARLAADGSTVLQTANPSGVGGSVSLRWQNTTAATIVNQTLRVDGACAAGCGADDVYRVRAFETTCRIPRFNNSGTQITLLLLQNPSAYLIHGNVWLWNAGGVLLDSLPFTLDAKQTLVKNTQTIAGAAGKAGTITVSHDGRYGDLTGKTVALEPSTGFSFDSPMVPVPR
jgi:hypothetical protein